MKSFLRPIGIVAQMDKLKRVIFADEAGRLVMPSAWGRPNRLCNS
jgi:hypothetical protein